MTKTTLPNQHLITAILALICTLFIAACNDVSTNNGDISQSALLERIKASNAPLILDVRSAGEYRSGHVPGAINIPHTALASRVNEVQISKDKEVVVYCERGVRAGIAGDILMKAGFGKIRHLSGDMSSWRGNKLPVEY
ncbi:MAG: rhodanese-like domain-containing protein [Gammaproteobacteria bacterium]|nr:rhodanese-like domain-containing protein [Gammaproteobacteria bacterium]